jgi:ATP-dependent Zn protease
MRRIEEGERRHTAIHEAGHVVVARVLGIPCDRVTIVADEDSAGHGLIPDPYAILDVWWEGRGKYHRTFESALRARVLAFMAGRQAEEEILGSCHDGDGEDRYQVASMLESLVRDAEVVRVAARFRMTTRALVRRHRAAIGRVAALLIRHGTLDAAAIDGALGRQ